ncbi:MAG: ferrochelatase [Planctomycetota bacterium]|nr:MAG: ferrochelatase [Planctomycetota bacterium]REK45943.1 MAG: ferrochelatase [Planctomycetota bacterium]
MAQYDAILVVSFGGPEGPDDVMPFLENVLRGKNVPRERMLEVAEHYRHFDGVSPINDQNRALIGALEAELAAKGPQLPIYWGNRNWHPTLPDTLRQMAADGIRRAIAFFTSAYSSYSGCRQYRENIAVAREEVGPEAPEVDKLRVFFNHPGFIEPNIENLRAALEQIPAARRDAAAIVYTAHSIPSAMADNCRYAAQLEDACRTVSEAVGRDAWRLVYQSRSGPPQQPWLEPDIGDYLRELRAGGATDAVVLPIGFISDHLEVIWDLDTEAQEIAGEIGLNMVRAATVGVHPRFITMIRELVEERMNDAADRPAVGRLGPSHDVCPQDCCLYTPRRPTG